MPVSRVTDFSVFPAATGTSVVRPSACQAAGVRVRALAAAVGKGQHQSKGTAHAAGVAHSHGPGTPPALRTPSTARSMWL